VALLPAPRSTKQRGLRPGRSTRCAKTTAGTSVFVGNATEPRRPDLQGYAGNRLCPAPGLRSLSEASSNLSEVMDQHKKLLDKKGECSSSRSSSSKKEAPFF
jgi:hypothetical protein